MGFSAEKGTSPEPFDAILGGETAAGEVSFKVPAGEAGKTHVFANIVSRLEGLDLGPQSVW